MITKFDTSLTEPKKGSSSIVFWIIGLGIVAYLGYEYVYKPSLEKDKKQ